jgi:hypothetical protein
MRFCVVNGNAPGGAADDKAFEICEFLSSDVRGMATKAAVEVAMQHFGVGRTTVYAAIKRLGFLFSLPVQSR